MNELNCNKYGIRVVDSMYKCFDYADEISLYNSIVPGLQSLIDICAVYASKWRFNFGIKKSQSMSTCYKPDYLIPEPYGI